MPLFHLQYGVLFMKLLHESSQSVPLSICSSLLTSKYFHRYRSQMLYLVCTGTQNIFLSFTMFPHLYLFILLCISIKLLTYHLLVAFWISFEKSPKIEEILRNNSESKWDWVIWTLESTHIETLCTYVQCFHLVGVKSFVWKKD